MSAISEPDLLRLAAVGSVDDGKSTLIGRLLADMGQVPIDQLEAIRRYSEARGDEYVDLSLVTDGLRAEREQGITIDVAYRFFATPRRAFVMADCPGHVSYTRNMITGASHADCVILLIDARQGMTDQTRRHAFLAALLKIPHFVVCVNKMDLVEYDASVFERIRAEYADFATRLGVSDVSFIPVSALRGDNVAARSDQMRWYEGPTLLYQLENLHVASDRDLVDLRLPIQYVMRPTPSAPDRRAYCGRLEGGVIRAGDDVVVLPTMARSRVTSVEDYAGPIGEAFPPMNVQILLADDLEVTRGYMLARLQNLPTIATELEVMIAGLSDMPITPGRTYAIRHTTRKIRGVVSRLRYRIDIRTLHRQADADSIGMNEIGRIKLDLAEPLFCDPYERNRGTGALLLLDDQDNRILAAGVVLARNVTADPSAA